MASSSPPEALQLVPSFWAEWGWPARGPSPASSPESGSGTGSLSPAAGTPPGARGLGARVKGGRRGRLGDGPRQSASQREKLRMRRLAGALRTLRRFLPPALAPADRSLTKVETLRLAARYIAHLSDLLRLPPPAAASPAWPAAPYCLPPPPAAAAASPGPHPGATAWPSSPPCALRPPAWEHPAAQPPPQEEDLSAQALPDELIAFLESFLPPEAQD